MNHVNSESIFIRAKKHLLYNTIPFLVFFLTFVVWLILRDGFAVNAANGQVYMEPFKYLHNLLSMPIVLALFLTGVVLVLWGIGRSLISDYTKGIWFSGIGTGLTVLALFLVAGYNNTAYYPSTFDLQSSLTIFNSSSSKFTLMVMSVVSLLVPIVVAYIWYVWRSMNSKRIDAEEMKTEGHIY